MDSPAIWLVIAWAYEWYPAFWLEFAWPFINDLCTDVFLRAMRFHLLCALTLLWPVSFTWLCAIHELSNWWTLCATPVIMMLCGDIYVGLCEYPAGVIPLVRARCVIYSCLRWKGKPFVVSYIDACVDEEEPLLFFYIDACGWRGKNLGCSYVLVPALMR